MGNELAVSFKQNGVVIIQPWKQEQNIVEYTSVRSLTELVVCRGTIPRYTG